MAITIRLDAQLEARLTALAERTGRPKALLVREAIIRHLAEMEEISWGNEAIRDWEANGRPSENAEQLWAELDEEALQGLRASSGSWQEREFTGSE